MRVWQISLCAIALTSGLIDSAAAQDAKTFRVTVERANVRADTSIQSTVIAQLPRGTSVEVIAVRLGWVNVTVQRADGTTISGYVAAGLGVLEAPSPPQIVTPASEATGEVSEPMAAKPEPQITSAANQQPALPVDRPTIQPVAPPPATAPIPRYRVGAGGHIGGSSFGIGGSVRYWATDKAAFEMQVSRFSVGIGEDVPSASVAVAVNASVIQLSPLLMFHIAEQAPDGEVWMRPYVGGGLNLFRGSSKLTVRAGRTTEIESESDTSVGLQVVGGSEIVFRDLPRLVLSADLGYHTTGNLFGASVGGFAYGIGVHWYFR